MKKILALMFFLGACITTQAQIYTTVIATLVDSNSQPWTGATVSFTFNKPFGNPAQPTNQGVAISSPANVITDGSGSFSVNLDNNVAGVTPAGTTWTFTMCPNATVNQCSQATFQVFGASENLSSALSAALIVPKVSATPTITRAYSNAEVSGGTGSVYANTTTNLMMFNQGTATSPNWQPQGYITSAPNPFSVVNGVLSCPSCSALGLSGQSPINFNVGTGVISCTTCNTGTQIINGVNSPITLDGSNHIQCPTCQTSAPPVSSVFTRTGAVTAQSGDYSFSQITGNIADTQNVFIHNPNSSLGDLGQKFVEFSVTLSTGSATQNFTSAFAVNPYCFGNDTTAANAVKIAATTVSAVVTGTGSDVIQVLCVNPPGTF